TRPRQFQLQIPIVLKYLDWSVKESVRYTSWDQFALHTQQNLPFAAAATRQRSWSVIAHAFPNRSLNSLPARAWRRYRADRLLKDLVAATLLLSWPPDIGHFVAVWLSRLVPGTSVTRELRDAFLVAEPLVADTQDRLFATFWHLGFLRRVGRRQYVVAERQM